MLTVMESMTSELSSINYIVLPVAWNYRLISMIESMNIFFILALKILSSQLTTERLLIRCSVSLRGVLPNPRLVQSWPWKSANLNQANVLALHRLEGTCRLGRYLSNAAVGQRKPPAGAR